MSSSTTIEAQHRGSRRGGGARCSHSSRLEVPVLDLGSNMSTQLAHEGNGTLLQRAQSCAPDERHNILQALSYKSADLSKAQMCGHCDLLTARLIESLLHYLLYRKNQVPEPINLLRMRKVSASPKATLAKGRRSHGDSTRTRREDKLLRKLAQLGHHLEAAVKQLSDNSGEGPSSRPHASQDLRLLIVMGTSASMPRDVLVLDLVQAVGRGSGTESDLFNVFEAGRLDGLETASRENDMEERLADLLSQASDQRRDAARDKTSSIWGGKLIRLVMKSESLESFFGTQLAPTKTHIFLSGPASFRCSGWSARRHLDFNLDHLCEAIPTDQFDPTSGSTDTSMSSLIADGAEADRRRAPSSPMPDVHRRWEESPRDSSSSVAESWPEDSASEQLWESSISSMSEDSRPPSVADKSWQADSNREGVSDGWFPACSSPSVNGSSSPSQAQHSIQASRTGSSLGSSTVYGHDTNDTAMEVSPETNDTAMQLRPDTYDTAIEVSLDTHDTAMNTSLDVLPISTEGLDTRTDGADLTDDSASSLSVGSAAVDTGTSVIQRRSREPRAGGLLARNLLPPRPSRQSSYAASDSSSVRSVASLKRAPRCVGLQVDFTDPDKVTDSSGSEAAAEERKDYCWYQCEVVLEGYR
ncbi:hypothetical protein PSEUBRA_001377 [Kalmanozyma brasiliensis GHG001]|uniref:uncharacterized protein n=1 Tax=Kalmanozyma brasiliensis (strain GHG001) TaxID=1365824 RepID=UPI002867FA4C|nr:uncharacterized protein PSEUBRA_001377 [Kalmanozyma brasiliensis GHG001]EST09045.2 hypothetical protein PSEUBRA_001377 [Kalmanozyma brasiliensis GHG001]